MFLPGSVRDSRFFFFLLQSSIEQGEPPWPQGGASGKCRYHYRVGFPHPTYPAKAGRGILADLPVAEGLKKRNGQSIDSFLTDR